MKKNKHTQGFKVPDSYFDSIEDRMFQKLEAEETLPKETGFHIPDGYFDNIEDRVMSTINDVNQQSAVRSLHRLEEPRVVSIFQRRTLVFALSIAACLAVIFTIALNNDQVAGENLDIATVSTYIDEGYLNLSIEEVSSLIDDEDLDELNITTLTTEEPLEEYLLDHIDEHNFLIE